MPSSTMSRRAVLGAALASGALAGKPASATAPVTPTERNATGARINIFTIVSPALEASVAYYTTLLDYRLAGRGAVPHGISGPDGAAVAGRRYALLKFGDSDQGMLRIVEAPLGAAANRPRPGSHAWDRGFGAIECSTSDIEESYQRLTRAGVKTLSPPTYYFFRDMRRLNGSTMYPKSMDTLTYVPIGPAGEMVYVSVVLPDNFGMKFTTLHSGCRNCFVVNPKREPVWAFYKAVFGLIPIAEYQGTRSSQRAVDRLLGETQDSDLIAGGMGDNFDMEYMQWTPPAGVATQYYPQSLDRTGHAMLTVSVNSIDEVAQRARASGLVPVGRSPLPTASEQRPPGFVLRGVCGELIEVIDRQAL